MSTRHTPRQWAIIADAIATADTATVDPFGDPLLRGGEDWCRVAFTAMEAPATIARASHLPDRLPPRCLLDRNLLRAWLAAPGPYPDPVVGTVADLVADRDWSQPADESTHPGLQRLLDAAQDAGVFGLDGFRLELYGVTGEDGWICDHLLIARPAVGPGLASQLLPGGVAPTEPMSNVDSAIAVLSTIAAQVDAILDGVGAAHRSPAIPGPARAGGHAFVPPLGAPGLASPAGPTSPPARPDASGRRSR